VPGEFAFRVLDNERLVWAFGADAWIEQELAPRVAELLRDDPELASFDFLIDLRTTTAIASVEYPPDRWVGVLRGSRASLAGTRVAFVGSRATALSNLSLGKPLATAWLDVELEFFRSVPLALTWLGRDGLEQARWSDRPA